MELSYGTLILEGKYSVVKLINCGDNGCTYEVLELKTKRRFAAKIDKEAGNEKSAIPSEAKILRVLKNIRGIPNYVDFACENQKNILITELAGVDLKKIFAASGKKFSNKTIYMFTSQMLEVLKTFHSKGMCHGDLKPANIAVGLMAQRYQLLLLDYGMVTRFKTTFDEFVEPVEGLPFHGSPTFASLQAHRGSSLSPKDDVESLLFISVYFLKEGWLPWLENLETAPKDKVLELISAVKLTYSMNELFKEFDVLGDIYQYISELDYYSIPDYDLLIMWLRNHIEVKLKETFDLKYDWLSRKRTHEIVGPVSVKVQKLQ